MNKPTLVLFVSIIAFAHSVHAQPARMSGPELTGPVAKLFGDNEAFSANVDYQTSVSAQQPATVSGKFAFDSGKSRFEMNLSEGGQLSPAYINHMKTMGMDQTVIISRPDAKVSYLVYPGLGAYTEMPLQDPDATRPASAFKIKTTALGRETVEGHACEKNKAVVTDDQGKTHEFTVWNAVDLKKFPIKIETSEEGRTTTILFKNIKISKPEAALFSPPSDYKKYATEREMMEQEMMKRRGVRAVPSGQP